MTSKLFKLEKNIQTFFVSPIPVTRLGLFRLLFCLAIALYLATHTFLIFSPYQGHYYPIPLFETLGIRKWDIALNKTLYGALIVFLIFAASGFKARLFLVLSSLCYFLFLGNHLGTMRSPNSPYVWHSHNMNLYLLMTLSLLPSIGQAKIRDVFTRFKKVASVNSAFHWEESVLVLVMCSGYFGSAYIKMLTAGLRWMDGYTLQAYLLQKHILTGNELALWLANHFPLLLFLSWATILLELVLVFFLLSKKWRFWVLGAVFCFHLVVLFSMEINFLFSHFLPYSMFFLAAFLHRRMEKYREVNDS